MRQKGAHQAERQCVLNSDQADNYIWSRVFGGQKGRREHIACSGNDDATMDMG